MQISSFSLIGLPQELQNLAQKALKADRKKSPEGGSGLKNAPIRETLWFGEEQYKAVKYSIQ